MVMTAEGKILRTRVDDVREIGRNAQGVRLIDMADTDRVVGVAKLAESSGEGASEGTAEGGGVVQTGTSPAPPPGTMEGEQSKKPLDPLVRTALALCISLIVITVVGMVLTAPDRSIPPYSVMAQQGEIVTVNVPPSTRDPEIEALLVRFQTVGHGDRNQFARLKIKPTTPADPAGLYQRVTIYVFANPGLAEEAALK